MEKNGKVVILLPGPPKEMQPMFEDHVMPYFTGKTQYELVSVYLRVFGIGESSMEERIMDLIREQENPTIAPYAKEGEVTLRVTARCAKNENADLFINPVVKNIIERLGKYVYSTENKNMEQVLAELLIRKNISISIAESCTGGFISKKLTDIPGISRVYKGSIVAYSNEIKERILGVKTDTISKHGAVSHETAREMARGVRKKTCSDIALSVTGIAGPGGGTPEKPVGLVYIALADKNTEKSREFMLWGDRERIRNLACLHAMDMARRYMLSEGGYSQEDVNG